MTDPLIAFGVRLTQIVLPILIVVGTVGNSLNVAVLIRPLFYPHACSRYLLATAVNNVFYSSLLLPINFSSLVINSIQSRISVYICKTMVFAFHSAAFISPFTIALASMERYFASATSAHLRQFSSVRISRWAIASVVTLLVLFNLNTFILITAQPDDGLGCRIPTNTLYNQIYGIVQASVYAVVAPFLMSLFGYLTMRNLRQVRVIPVVISTHRRTERQLARMLLLQVSIYIVLNLPISVTYLISFLPVDFKTTSQFYLMYTITQTLTYTFNSASFITYILSTRSYRQECIRIVKKILRIKDHGNHRMGMQTIPMTVGNRQTNTIEPILTQ